MENIAAQIKGTIHYPCCPKEKVMPYIGTSGKVSQKCPNCGKFVLFDFDLMTAVRTQAAKGIAQKFK